MTSRREALASIGDILPFTAPQAFAARMGVVFVKAESAVGLTAGAARVEVTNAAGPAIATPGPAMILRACRH